MPVTFHKYKVNKYLRIACINDRKGVELTQLQRIWNRCCDVASIYSDDSVQAKNVLKKLKSSNQNIKKLKPNTGILLGLSKAEIYIEDAATFLTVQEDTAIYQFFLLILLGIANYGDTLLFIWKHNKHEQYKTMLTEMKAIVQPLVDAESEQMQKQQKRDKHTKQNRNQKRTQKQSKSSKTNYFDDENESDSSDFGHNSSLEMVANNNNNNISGNDSNNRKYIDNAAHIMRNSMASQGFGYNSLQELKSNGITLASSGRSANTSKMLQMDNFYNFKNNKIVKTRNVNYNCSLLNSNYNNNNTNNNRNYNTDNSNCNYNNNINNSNYNAINTNCNYDHSNTNNNKINTNNSGIVTQIETQATKSSDNANTNKSKSVSNVSNPINAASNESSDDIIYSFGTKIGYIETLLPIFEKRIVTGNQSILYTLICSIHSKTNYKWQLLPMVVPLIQCQKSVPNPFRINKMCEILRPDETKGFSRVSNPSKITANNISSICFRNGGKGSPHLEIRSTFNILGFDGQPFK